MKNRFLLIIIMSGLIGIAQFDKSSCPANLSIFAEFAKVKNYAKSGHQSKLAWPPSSGMVAPVK